MSTRDGWYDAYRMRRATCNIEDGGRFTAPRWDEALSIAFNGYDPLKGNKAGRYLGLMNQKRNTIRRQGVWFGFGFNAPTYNCRCVVMPITAPQPAPGQPNPPRS